MKSNDMTRCRVMVVDSSMEMLSLMTALFRPYGFDMLTVAMPDEAVKLAAEFVPHAIYMGLEYSDCDGWDLAKRFRKVPGLRRTMLVGLVDRDKGWQSEDGVGNRGFNYYLPKPPRMRDIVVAMTVEPLPAPPVAPSPTASAGLDRVRGGRPQAT